MEGNWLCQKSPDCQQGNNFSYVRQLTTIILYTAQLSNSSSNISESFAKIISATGAFEGVLDMLRWESLVKEAPDAIDHITPTGEI